MEKKKCSLIEHKDIDSKIYCEECNIYLCNKCENYHIKLFPNHHTFNSDKDINEIFTGFCKEKGHPIKLDFFCKNHNKLCCGLCIAKIQKEDIGKHKDCNVCTIEEIKEEKKNKIDENIIYLKEISNTLQKSIEELKSIFEKINANKEEIKLKIQKVFTKIRNELNNREDELLLEVDKKFDENYCNEKILKDIEILPAKIEDLLSRTEDINKYYNDNKLSFFLNICLNVENNIKNIMEINDSIKKCKNTENKKINYFPKDEEEINKFLDNIKKFGKLNDGGDDIQNSLIIQENEIELIKNFIGKNPKFKLLYRATVDGDTKEDFDKKCLNKQPTLALIKNKLGNRFGGYTIQNWNYDQESDKKDPLSFIFSLDRKKKYNLKNNNNRAIHTKSYIIYFGNADFCLNKNFLTENSGWCNTETRYFEANSKDLSDQEHFIVQEFELYQVLF